jgi:DNA helicase-2/ATP-dependent DNA helicase PcrA
MECGESSLFKNLMDFSSGKPKNPVVKKKLKPSELLLKNIEGFGFDMKQLETVLKTQGNQLIVSGAGSGKTTSLIFKIIYDIKTGFATKVIELNGNNIRVPESIWVSTFLKSGAEELGDSLRKWQSKLGCNDVSAAIKFSTLHAEFKRALNMLGVSTNIISGTENTKLLKDLVKSYAIKNEKGRDLNADNIRSLEGALTYTRNRLDEKKYIQNVYDDFNLGPAMVDALLRDWKAARVGKGFVDFEDLQETLYHECYVKNNADVINFLSGRYKFIYIDEFQDTSQIQYALLKVYCKDAKQVVAIGDDDQTIYSWRGSCNDIITKDFLADFNPVRNDLSVNFRCPSNILDAIKPSIKNNINRFDKDLKSFKQGGLVRYGGYPSYKQMVSSLCDMISEDVGEGNSVAVLCRVNSDGLMPALILDKLNKFSFSISGDGMTLDSYIGRCVIGIVKLFTERSTPAVKGALNSLTWDTYSINNLMKVCKDNKLSIWNIDAKDLAYSCPSIASIIITWRGWVESVGEVEALKLVLQFYRTRVYNKDSQFNTVIRSVISSVEALLEYFEYDYVEDFLMELEDINERLKARKNKSKSQIRIATVHEFKGKESDSVYVWNDTVDVFPYKESLASDEEYEEERRVHYIACTRAKKKSTIMFLRDCQGDFVREMDLSNAENIGVTNITGTLIKKELEEDANLQKFEREYSEEETGYDSYQTNTDRYRDAEYDFNEKMHKGRES